MYIIPKTELRRNLPNTIVVIPCWAWTKILAAKIEQKKPKKMKRADIASTSPDNAGVSQASSVGSTNIRSVDLLGPKKSQDPRNSHAKGPSCYPRLGLDACFTPNVLELIVISSSLVLFLLIMASYLHNLGTGLPPTHGAGTAGVAVVPPLGHRERCCLTNFWRRPVIKTMDLASIGPMNWLFDRSLSTKK